MRAVRVIGGTLVAVGMGLAMGIGWAYYRVQSAYDPKVLIHGRKAHHEPTALDQPLPKLVLEQTEYNFGILDEGVTQRHTFVFRNEGQGVLTLTAGTTTCGCTLLDLSKTEVSPGGSTEVVVEWNTKNRPGPFRQSATVYTNDPKRREVALVILGEVRPTIKVSPSELVFRNIRVGEEISGEVKIFSYIAQDFQITNHQWENTGDNTKMPPLEVSISPLSEDQLKESSSDSSATSEASRVQPRSGFLVQVRSEPFSAMGTYIQKLLLKTNQPENPQLEIPVEVTVGSDISLFGPGWNERAGILTFLPIRRGQQAQRQLTIACRGPLSSQVQYQIVSVEPKFLQVELGSPNRVGDGQASLTPLVVRIPSNVGPVTYLGGEDYPLGKILLSTTHPHVPQLEIKVRFAVEP